MARESLKSLRAVIAARDTQITDLQTEVARLQEAIDSASKKVEWTGPEMMPLQVFLAHHGIIEKIDPTFSPVVENMQFFRFGKGVFITTPREVYNNYTPEDKGKTLEFMKRLRVFVDKKGIARQIGAKVHIAGVTYIGMNLELK